MAKRKSKKPEAVRELAERIADALFTAFEHNPVKCDHLKGFIGCRYVAGWSEEPMAKYIEKILTDAGVQLGKGKD